MLSVIWELLCEKRDRVAIVTDLIFLGLYLTLWLAKVDIHGASGYWGLTVLILDLLMFAYYVTIRTKLLASDKEK